ncbi:hypothetical protein K488DRAFT_46727, partial [Vararia minispora EC-137]
WIIGPCGERFLWVPPEFREVVHLPPLQFLISSKRLVVDFSHSAHGKDWWKCYVPTAATGSSSSRLIQ